VTVYSSAKTRQDFGGSVDFFAFDDGYLDRLRKGDPETERHFAAYFGKFLRIRLRARRLAADAIDDVVQETLLRVMRTVHASGIRRAECFGSFVNSICSNILLEYYRSSAKNRPVDGAIEAEDKVLNLDGLLVTQETAKRVRRILEELPQKDRNILRSLFFEEKEKDAICVEFGIARDYLRVLVHRAKDKFRVLYEMDQSGGARGVGGHGI
jgi:RNA polymerase sigma-70 factor, ECF subfamily